MMVTLQRAPQKLRNDRGRTYIIKLVNEPPEPEPDDASDEPEPDEEEEIADDEPTEEESDEDTASTTPKE